MEWAEARARLAVPKSPPEAKVVLATFCNQKDRYTVDLFNRFGMYMIRHFLQMLIEFDGEPQPPVIPEGILIRPYDQATELEKIAEVYYESFQDHFGYAGQTLETQIQFLRHRVKHHPGFDPSLWFLAEEEGEAAGIALCYPSMTTDPAAGHVMLLGVRRAWRQRGLGLALLQHSFVELYQRGCQRVGLSVDASNLTGATRLYEKAGMSVKERYDLFDKVLREGEDLVKQ
jgi:ribosomal protein S18 acetylase RimI-like enzyme